MWSVFLTVFGLVAVAELGDKTQFMAIAFACKYRWQDVLLGIVAAVLILMGIAVLAGEYILRLLPGWLLKLVAGLLFLYFAFAIWRNREEREGEEKINGRSGRSPFWATFITFFVAELGDKTQLLTMALAAQNQQPLPTWLGACMAMIVVDGLAVVCGGWLSRILKPAVLRVLSMVLFTAFGLLTILSIWIPALSF